MPLFKMENQSLFESYVSDKKRNWITFKYFSMIQTSDEIKQTNKYHILNTGTFWKNI